MKKVFSFFLAIIVFVSVAFCSFGSVAVSGTDADADYVKGLIISLSAVCGLAFPDWTTAAAFSNDFFNKIMSDQTESQLNFLSAISELDYSDINDNFSSATVSPLILQAFEAALIDTYGINIDTALGDISNSIKLNDQYAFPEIKTVISDSSGNPVYLFGDRFSVSDLTVGLNLWYSSPGFAVDLYIYYDGSRLYPVVHINNTHYIRLSYSGISVSSYDVDSLSLSLKFYHRYYDADTTTGYLDVIPIEDFSHGGYAYSNWSKPNSSILDQFGFLIGISYIDSSDGLIGIQAAKNDSIDDIDCFIYNSDVTSLISGSNGYESWSEPLLNDFRLNNDDNYYLYYKGNYIFECDFTAWGLDLVGYNYPFYNSTTENRGSIEFYEIYQILLSYAFGYVDYGIGTLLFDEMFVYIDSDYLTTDNNLRDQMQSESVSVRIPYNIDNIIENEDDIVISPVPDDTIDDGSDVGGTDGGSSGSGDSGSTINPPDIPELDDSTIGDYLSSFVDSISRFFSWNFEFLSTVPQDISFPILGGFISMICIGVVALII